MEETNKLAEITLQDMVPIVITVVIIAVGAAFGIDALTDVKTQFGEDACGARTDTLTTYNESTGTCINSTGSSAAPGTFQTNASDDGLTAAAKFPERLPLIATVLIAALLIGILVSFLVVRLTR